MGETTEEALSGKSKGAILGFSLRLSMWLDPSDRLLHRDIFLVGTMTLSVDTSSLSLGTLYFGSDLRFFVRFWLSTRRYAF